MVDTPLINQMRELAHHIKDKFDAHFSPYENDKHIHRFEGWQDWFWTSDKVRKAHLKIIEPAGKNRKMWLMHMNVFPAYDMDIPIFGLDIVATPNKISGCFCDFSPTNDSESQQEFMAFFKSLTQNLEWKRERELPPWAAEIFSEDMIAAGAVREGDEANQLSDAAQSLLDFYLDTIDKKSSTISVNTKDSQNKYCVNQKMNKLLHTSIIAMGIAEEDKDQYVNDVLFEEDP